MYSYVIFLQQSDCSLFELIKPWHFKSSSSIKLITPQSIILLFSVVSIKQNGSLVKAQSVSPNYAIQEFEKICNKVQSYVLQNA